ncbi:MAG: hypothetical protein ACLTXW_12775 [Christensenellales bacterium]
MNKVVVGLLCLLMVVLLFCTVLLLLLSCWTHHVELMVFAVKRLMMRQRTALVGQVRGHLPRNDDKVTPSDSLIYQQYKDSENAEKLSWAESGEDARKQNGGQAITNMC